jgi:redox-sensing transcriptional repressor
MKLPGKTIERLSQYRRMLLNCSGTGKTHIYSHELADMLNLTAVQVRRDIMLMGYSTSLKKGYDIQELIDVIGSFWIPGKARMLLLLVSVTLGGQ